MTSTAQSCEEEVYAASTVCVLAHASSVNIIIFQWGSLLSRFPDWANQWLYDSKAIPIVKRKKKMFLSELKWKTARNLEGAIW